MGPQLCLSLEVRSLTTSVEWFQGVVSGAGAPTAATGVAINSLCHSTDYYVTVTDANGCVQNLQIPQVSAPAPINISTAVTDVECNGNGNGTVNATLLQEERLR